MVLDNGIPERNVPVPLPEGINKDPQWDPVMFSLKAWDNLFQSTPSKSCQTPKALTEFYSQQQKERGKVYTASVSSTCFADSIKVSLSRFFLHSLSQRIWCGATAGHQNTMRRV